MSRGGSIWADSAQMRWVAACWECVSCTVYDIRDGAGQLGTGCWGEIEVPPFCIGDGCVTGGPRRGRGRGRESRRSWSKGGMGVDNGQASASGSWNPQKSVGFQSGPGHLTVWPGNSSKREARGAGSGQRQRGRPTRGRWWDLGRTGVELNISSGVSTRPEVRTWASSDV